MLLFQVSSETPAQIIAIHRKGKGKGVRRSLYRETLNYIRFKKIPIHIYTCTSFPFLFACIFTTRDIQSRRILEEKGKKKNIEGNFDYWGAFQLLGKTLVVREDFNYWGAFESLGKASVTGYMLPTGVETERIG